MIAPERIESMLASLEREGWGSSLAQSDSTLASPSRSYWVRRGEQGVLGLVFSPAWVSVQTPLAPDNPGRGSRAAVSGPPRGHRHFSSGQVLAGARRNALALAELPTEQFSVFQLRELFEAVAKYRPYENRLAVAAATIELQAASWKANHASRPLVPLSDAQVEAFFAQIAKEGWSFGERRGDDGWPAA